MTPTLAKRGTIFPKLWEGNWALFEISLFEDPWNKTGNLNFPSWYASLCTLSKGHQPLFFSPCLLLYNFSLFHIQFLLRDDPQLTQLTSEGQLWIYELYRATNLNQLKWPMKWKYFVKSCSLSLTGYVRRRTIPQETVKTVLWHIEIDQNCNCVRHYFSWMPDVHGLCPHLFYSTLNYKNATTLRHHCELQCQLSSLLCL